MNAAKHITSVTVEPVGAHERVWVWVNSQSVGSLTVGKGDGEWLRGVLLAAQPATAPCTRTYPLDPNTAEDPCDDCGRDQRKHEIAPALVRPRLSCCIDGDHSFSWRQGLEPCRYCGEPKKP